MGELGYPQLEPTRMWMDNSGALNLAERAESLGRSRHIARRANFLQMATSQLLLRCGWVSTEHLVADMLTKPLDRKRFVALRERLMGRRSSMAATAASLSSKSAASKDAIDASCQTRALGEYAGYEIAKRSQHGGVSAPSCTMGIGTSGHVRDQACICIC